MTKFPPIPQEVKPIAHLLKLADEHEERNIVVTYWARMAACLLALRLVPGKKSPETGELIRALLSWLEETKKANHDNDGITNDTAAQALIEDYAIKMFEHADAQDKAEVFNKSTVKVFYTCGILFDVLEQFSKLDDDIMEKRKYAKWKAAYIHNCLKSGEKPLPGPPRPMDDEAGIIENDRISEDDLKSFQRFAAGGPESDGGPASDTGAPSTNLFPKPSDEGNFTHAPTSSPVTPMFPSNPTSFNTPAPTQPQIDPPTPSLPPTIVTPTPAPVRSSNENDPTPEQIQKAQKFCKFATSALNYDDVKNAMDYLQKAMNLLNCKDEE